MAAINAEIPDDLKKQLDRACVERDITIKVALAESIRKWLGLDDEPSADDPIVDSLREFLTIAEPGEAKALKVNIEVFLGHARRRPRPPAKRKSA